MDDDIGMSAGEYVLGTLDAAEQRAFRRRLLTDPEAVAAMADWQGRLAPLLLTATEVPPPPGLWRRIEAGGAANDNRPLRRWQAATAAAVAVALVGVGLAFNAPSPPRSVIVPAAAAPQLQSIAALSENGGSPALLVTYDRATKMMRVTPVNVTPRPGHSLELWMIAGKAPPKSLGLMREKSATALGGMVFDLAHDMTIAVSVEPMGGSPTGLPTGPVVYSGRMIAMPTS